MSQVCAYNSVPISLLLSIRLVPARASLRAEKCRCSATLLLHFDAQFAMVKDFGVKCHISCKRKAWAQRYNMWKDRRVFMGSICCSGLIQTPLSLEPILCAPGKVPRTHFSVTTAKKGTSSNQRLAGNSFYLLWWWVPELCACLNCKIRLIASHPSRSE